MNCCSYICITNPLLSRDILANKLQILNIPTRNVEGGIGLLSGKLGSYLANWALIWQWKMFSEVASQCKGNVMGL